jgi:hypothetical protein
MEDPQKIPLQKIKQAAEGLLYRSESDYPFDTISLPHASNALEDQLQPLSGKGKDARIEVVTLEHFFRNMVKVYSDATPEQLQVAKRYQHLLQVLNEELSDCKVYRIGAIQIDIFLVGKLPDGTYAGLRTKAIET